ncbi:MAG: exopolysaccharide transport family protein [Rhizomicrobium sp.]
MAVDRTASAFASAPATADVPFRFGDFLRVLDERRALIRNITILVVGLTVLAVMSLPTLYSTSSVVMLDQRKNNVADLSSVLSALPTDPSSVQNQIQLLSSRELALRVISRLKLYDDPEFNPALNSASSPSLIGLLNPANWGHSQQAVVPSPDYLRDAIVSNFLSHLDVSALGLSTSITVTYTAGDPAKAARIANALADAYTEDQVATKVAAARNATQWLTDRMHQMAQQIQIEESAVEQYKAQNNLVDSTQGNSLVEQQLAAINAQLVAAQSDLAEKQATYDRVAAVVRSGNAADISQIVASQTIVALRAQEADLVRQEADLSTRYGSNHPKMLAIQTQKRDLEQKITEEVTRIAGSIANDVAVARVHVASIEASLARVVKQAGGDSMARVKLNALEANVASTRTMYESFVSRLRATQDQDDIQNPEARVISRAPIPTTASSPHRVLFVAASLPAGLLLGILAALLAEKLQAPMPKSDLRPRAAAPVFALPNVLAELPAVNDMRAASVVIDQPGAPYSQALSHLLTQFTSHGFGKVVMLTSPAADPGKSVIALGLARAASLRGLRTILVDGDFERPFIATAMGIRVASASVADILNGSIPLSRALHKDPRSNALILSATQPAGQGPWSTNKMGNFLGYLRQNCDLVLIDATPVPRFAHGMTRLCDQIVLIAQGRAPQFVLDGAMRALASHGAPPPGLVITR